MRTAVRLGHPQQPDEPLHGRLGPLVHGRQLLSAGANWPREAVGRQPRAACLAQDAGPPIMDFAGNIPYSQVGQNWPIRVPGQQPLAVLERPDVGQGPAHGQGRLRVPQPQLPVQGLGRGDAAASSTSTGSAPAATTRPATTSPDRRSVRLVPARAGAGLDADHPRVPDVQRGLHRAVGERRVQGVGPPDAHAGHADRLPDRPHRAERPVLDLRSEHAEPRRRRTSRGR